METLDHNPVQQRRAYLDMCIRVSLRKRWHVILSGLILVALASFFLGAGPAAALLLGCLGGLLSVIVIAVQSRLRHASDPIFPPTRNTSRPQ